VPVTARFSSQFYERLGDDVAEELVNWFNAVHDDSRDLIRQLNDRNWSSFAERLDARAAELRAEFRSEIRASASELRAELIKWMFAFWIAFWAATVIPLGGLILQLR
jgi:hypothetical protein